MVFSNPAVKVLHPRACRFPMSGCGQCLWRSVAACWQLFVVGGLHLCLPSRVSKTHDISNQCEMLIALKYFALQQAEAAPALALVAAADGTARKCDGFGSRQSAKDCSSSLGAGLHVTFC